MNDTQKKITAVLVALLVCANSIAVAFGFDYGLQEATITAAVTAVVTLAGFIWNTYHNWNHTDAAKIAQQITDGIKANEMTIQEVAEFIDAVRKRNGDA